MERRVNVFFYGLFMDADALRSKGLHPNDIRQARVDGVKLQAVARRLGMPEDYIAGIR